MCIYICVYICIYIYIYIYNNFMYNNRYNTEWYTAPLWLQKLIFFMMQRSKIKSALTAGGLFDASLEGFARVKNAKISFLLL